MGWLLTVELYDNAKGIMLLKGVISFGYYTSKRRGFGIYFSLFGLLMQVFFGLKEIEVKLPRNISEA